MTRIGELIGLSALNGSPMQPAVEAVRGIMANGHRKVLVVGSRGDNFTAEYREHPQLLFWDDMRDRAPVVPKQVSLVLVTRFMGHSVYDSLKEQAKSVGAVFVNHPLGTGQIRELLRPFLKTSEAKEAPVTEDKKVGQTVRDFARGELQAFVVRHANLDAVPVVLEVRRLVELARSQGYEPSEPSMASALQRAKSRRNEPASEEYGQPTQAQPHVVMPDDDAELLRMLDDAMAAMGLVRQAIVERSAKRAQLRDLLKHI